ncbi:PREDICTED: uncharacterized protein LOC104383604, partial [Tauraco erythrolophus]|uniref:uncharacterized protein LOC104383604 n=1 Tax=Tauraco erythrolophus TaxID=121530 RepID=UPI000523344D
MDPSGTQKRRPRRTRELRCDTWVRREPEERSRSYPGGLIRPFQLAERVPSASTRTQSVHLENGVPGLGTMSVEPRCCFAPRGTAACGRARFRGALVAARWFSGDVGFLRLRSETSRFWVSVGALNGYVLPNMLLHRDPGAPEHTSHFLSVFTLSCNFVPRSAVAPEKLGMFFSPSGKKFRSKPQLARYLGSSMDLSSFDFRTGKMLMNKMNKNRQRMRYDCSNQAKGKPDLNTALPVRQTASIFKQPVTKITNHPSNKVKSDPQKAVDQPRQFLSLDEIAFLPDKWYSSYSLNSLIHVDSESKVDP